jgi:hypothetical protein
MRLELDLDHDIGALRLYEPNEEPRTAETLRVEHRLGDKLGELILKFDAEGRLFSITFMHPRAQLRPSQLTEA